MVTILGLDGLFNGNEVLSFIHFLNKNNNIDNFERYLDFFLLDKKGRENIINFELSNNFNVENKNHDDFYQFKEFNQNYDVNDHEFDDFKQNNNLNFDYKNFLDNEYNLCLIYNSNFNDINCNNSKYDTQNGFLNNNSKYKMSNDFLNNNSYENSVKYPLKYKNFILVFEGIIYNREEIQKILKIQNIDLFKDEEIIINLVNFFIDKEKLNFLNAIKKTIAILNGDYVFGIFNGTDIAICRDKIGIRPLYYGKIDKNTNNLSKNSSYNINNYNIFSSEKKLLWKAGIEDENILSLKPGTILYNWEKIPLDDVPWNPNLKQKYNTFKPKNTPLSELFLNKNVDDINSYLNHENIADSVNSYLNKNIKYSSIGEMDYDKIKEKLKDILLLSTYNRIKDLDDLGLIFSGGVDSTILAILLKNYCENNDSNLNLYSVANKNSKDLEYSKKIAKQFDLPLKIQPITEKVVKNNLDATLRAVGEFNIMKIGVGMVFYLSTKMAKKDGLNVVLSGQGADELFAGYNRYLSIYENGGELAIDKALKNDVEFDYKVNLQRDYEVSRINGVELRNPFLDEKFVEFALSIPVKYKLNSSKDKLRKRILRDLAIDLGVPDDVAMRFKKAAQYGSGIDKILRKKILRDFDFNSYLMKFRNDI